MRKVYPPKRVVGSPAFTFPGGHPSKAPTNNVIVKETVSEVTLKISKQLPGPSKIIDAIQVQFVAEQVTAAGGSKETIRSGKTTTPQGISGNTKKSSASKMPEMGEVEGKANGTIDPGNLAIKPKKSGSTTFSLSNVSKKKPPSGRLRTLKAGRTAKNVRKNQTPVEKKCTRNANQLYYNFTDDKTLKLGTKLDRLRKRKTNKVTKVGKSVVVITPKIRSIKHPISKQKPPSTSGVSVAQVPSAQARTTEGAASSVGDNTDFC